MSFGWHFRPEELKISDPWISFWIGELYDTITNDNSGKQSNECCEVLMKMGESDFLTACSDCRRHFAHYCAIDSQNISRESSTADFTTWSEAFEDCADKNMMLPSQVNKGLLEAVRAHDRPLWTDVVRRVNIAPNRPKNGDYCLCSLGDISYYQNCHTRRRTLCFPDTTQKSDGTHYPYTSMRTVFQMHFNNTTQKSSGTYYPDTSIRTVEVNNTIFSPKLTGIVMESATNPYAKDRRPAENWTLSGTIIGILSTLLLLALMILLVIALKLRKILRLVEQKGKSQDEFAQIDLSSAYQTLNSRSNQPENVYNTLKIDTTVP